MASPCPALSHPNGLAGLMLCLLRALLRADSVVDVLWTLLSAVWPLALLIVPLTLGNGGL